MQIKEMYVYWQNNSGGYSKEIRKTYKDNMLILPVKCMEATTHSYEHLAVADKEIIPKEVYFDGVEKGLDCSCCVATDGADWMNGTRQKRFTYTKIQKNLKNPNLEDLNTM